MLSVLENCECTEASARLAEDEGAANRLFLIDGKLLAFNCLLLTDPASSAG